MHYLKQVVIDYRKKLRLLLIIGIFYLFFALLYGLMLLSFLTPTFWGVFSLPIITLCGAGFLLFYFRFPARIIDKYQRLPDELKKKLDAEWVSRKEYKRLGGLKTLYLTPNFIIYFNGISSLIPIESIRQIGYVKKRFGYTILVDMQSKAVVIPMRSDTYQYLSELADKQEQGVMIVDPEQARRYVLHRSSLPRLALVCLMIAVLAWYIFGFLPRNSNIAKESEEIQAEAQIENSTTPSVYVEMNLDALIAPYAADATWVESLLALYDRMDYEEQ